MGVRRGGYSILEAKRAPVSTPDATTTSAVSAKAAGQGQETGPSSTSRTASGVPETTGVSVAVTTAVIAEETATPRVFSTRISSLLGGSRKTVTHEDSSIRSTTRAKTENSKAVLSLAVNRTASTTSAGVSAASSTTATAL